MWKSAGVQGVERVVTKCDRFITALCFLQVQRTPPNDAPKQAEIASAVERIKLWKPTLRKIKQLKQIFNCHKACTIVLC